MDTEGDTVVTNQKERKQERTADGEPVHSFLCRIPESLHERLRLRAFEDRRPKAEIVRDALNQYLR